MCLHPQPSCARCHLYGGSHFHEVNVVGFDIGQKVGEPPSPAYRMCGQAPIDPERFIREPARAGLVEARMPKVFDRLKPNGARVYYVPDL